MKKTKLRPLSKITDTESLDSIKRQKAHFGQRRAFEVLMQAQRAWDAMSNYRHERERNKRYTYGDQWKDEITVDGVTSSEEDYIRRKGNVPLKNNIIRKLVRTVLGVYRAQSKEPTCIARDRDEQQLGETMSVILQCNQQLNKMNELYARSMEEFLIGGLVVHRKWFGWKGEKRDCWTDIVPVNNFFIDPNVHDIRGWDISLIGEIHDISFNSLCREFAHSAKDVQRLREIYRIAADKYYVVNTCNNFGETRLENYDFLLTPDPTLCRVIEVWRKESKPRYRCHDLNTGEIFKIEQSDYVEMVKMENETRISEGLAVGMAKEDIPLIEAEWFMDDYWYFYYLSPFGDILLEGETPYAHHSHPYVMKAYPFLDGEIHSFVSDIIDQQRYINRLITTHDMIMRTSAKGLLIFPEDCLPKGMDIKEIADEWSRHDGVIVIKKGAKMLPQQIASNSTNIGIFDLLNMEYKLLEDISGVTGSLQGKQGFAGMSASLYNQQTQNATTSLLDLLESFSSFVLDGAYKDVKNIQQFYDDRRVFNIAGKRGQIIVYDPSMIADVEFDLNVTESMNTPVYRQIANDFLLEIWRSGQISLQQLLENGDFPFADQLLQSLQVQQEQLEQGQTPQGLSPELQQQMQAGANPEAMQQAQTIMRQ